MNVIYHHGSDIAQSKVIIQVCVEKIDLGLKLMMSKLKKSNGPKVLKIFICYFYKKVLIKIYIKQHITKCRCRLYIKLNISFYYVIFIVRRSFYNSLSFNCYICDII